MLESNFYSGKNERYFDGAREDFIDELPENMNANILEIGCGAGNTGAYARSLNKCGVYIGVEIHETSALKAKDKISQVIIGDIEKIPLPFEDNFFDVLILSEVLEHLVDPWKVLQKLHRFLKPGAIILASSPNVSNYHVILMLLKGEWSLADDGVMDRTHLRWFTPSSFADMFESSGYDIVKVEPLSPFRLLTRLQIALMFGRGKHLFFKQIKIKAIKR